MKRGYTLVEMLIATTLTLVMMGGVATVFGMIGGSVSGARASLEMADALRAAAHRLDEDLDGVTVTMSPPRRPENNQGYFEYIEGPFGPEPTTDDPAYKNTNDNPNPATAPPDNTVADTDDRLLFTTRSRGEPFIGRRAGSPIPSQDAEVAWFVRGRMLYRRVLLIRPDSSLAAASQSGFYNNYDISARLDRDSGGNLVLTANSLGDLTNRECRYAHHYRATLPANDDVFPFSAARWGQLGLPTLGECSHGSWTIDGMNPSSIAPAAVNNIDLWNNPHPWTGVDPETGVLNNYLGPRVGEDVVLSNVLEFDVRAWDANAPILRAVNDNGTPPNLNDDSLISPNVVILPGDAGYSLALRHLLDELAKPPGMRNPDYLPIGYGAYVDLGYASSTAPAISVFSGNGNQTNLPRVYDTWSLRYEYDGIDQDGDGATDEGTNGFDDDGDGVVDDTDEMECPPPYAAPLRGIQVKIRVFEPDSRQIREVTIVHDFAR